MNAALHRPRKLVRKHLAHAAGTLLLALALPAAHASLVDGGFETNPLVGSTAVLSNFAATAGSWGQESSVITTTTGGITPFAGVQMLEMSPNGGVTTQAFQAIDVSSYSPGAIFSLGARFNVANTTSAFAGLSMSFYSGPNASSAQTAPFAAASLNLDGSAGTWQPINLSGAIPIGTQWILAQVYFSNASLGNQRGYVDGVELDINAVPEPGSLALATAGLLAIGWRARRKSADYRSR